MKEKLVLIDGHSILNRAFYAIPNLTTTKGEHTNAVLGFINIMLKIIEEENPSYLTVAFDVNKKTFRHKMFPEYKGTRKAMPEELKAQVPLIKEVLQAMNITTIEKEGFEADDILGTMAVNAEKEGYITSIISGDKDLLQLASDNIKIRIPKTKARATEIEDYLAKDVYEKYNVTSKQFIDLKGLMGDSSDNIPGVKGVGEKTATKLIVEFGSIENLYNNLDKLKKSKVNESIIENKDIAFLSKELATIKTDCDINYNIIDSKINDMFNNKTYEMFKRLEFKSLLSRFKDEIDHESKDNLTLNLINDFNKAEEYFMAFESEALSQNIGISLLIENKLCLGLSICSNSEEATLILIEGFITLEYLKERIKTLINKGYKLSINDLKEALDFIDFIKEDSIFDCKIAAYLLNPIKDSYNYDDIARDYLNFIIPSKNDLIGKNSISKLLNDDLDKVLKYSAYNSVTSFLARDVLESLMKDIEIDKLFYSIEMPLVYTLYNMEKRGIGVNKKNLQKFSAQLAEKIKELEKDIYELAGEEFNINSPKQLGIILFEKLNLPFAKKTKTGYSTAVDILEKLRYDHEIINKILEYRQIAKLKSTYADGLLPYIEEDGRIRSHFNQTITATGRISSTEPNLQNIPIKLEIGKNIRKAFIAEEGYIFIDGDYSQIELRVLAHMSEDKKLIKAYKEAKDIHQITASEVFNIEIDKVTPSQRSNAKAVNFGIVYGISSFGLGQDLNISKKEASKYIENYFKTYKEVKSYLDNLVSFAKERGTSKTLFGRLRPIPEINSSNFMQRSFGERIAMNSPIQGTAADIIKIAMIAVDKRFINDKMKSRLILQVHDELLIEAHLDEADRVRDILKEEMLNAANLLVPLEVNIKEGSSWYDTI